MYMYAETGEVIPLKCTRINAANILRTGLDNEAYKPPFFPPQLSPLFKLVFHRSGFAQGQQSASPLSATTIHTEMMDFHWTTCEPIPDLQNALRGLNEPAYPFIDSEDWAKSLFLGSDTIVRYDPHARRNALFCVLGPFSQPNKILGSNSPTDHLPLFPSRTRGPSSSLFQNFWLKAHQEVGRSMTTTTIPSPPDPGVIHS